MVRPGASAILLRAKEVRACPLLGVLIALALVAAPSIRQQRPLLIWNASSSAPVGLYAVDQASPAVGDLVVLRLPSATAMLAARRGYLPRSAYLLKPVAAVAGDRVCRIANRIRIRGRVVAIAYPADDAGRAMPAWYGCRVLSTGSVFVLADHPASFDSRYFGPFDARSLVGRGRLLWSRPTEG